MGKKMNLGELLNYAQRNEIFTHPARDYEGCHFPYDKHAVQITHFAMQCHSHDTGDSVRVYIVGLGLPYKIIEGTYWKRSGYDHNPFFHERGSWDDELDEAIDMLRNLVESDMDVKAITRREKEVERAAYEQARKDAMNEIFKNHKNFKSATR